MGRMYKAITEDLENYEKNNSPEKHPNPQRPAYPTNNRMFSSAQGLSKREYFAGLAMQKMIEFGSWDIREEVIKRSIDFADELLKQLGE